MSACIEFEGYKNWGGYGQVCRQVNGKPKSFYAHRLAYAEVHGEIPPGMLVCHRCDNRACVNVEHLFLGTHLDNNRDRAAKGRGAKFNGSAHPNAKLTEQDIPRIRELLKTSYSQTEIGKMFGVGQDTISLIKHGKTWTHVA